MRHRLIEIMLKKAKKRDRGRDSRRETYGKRHGGERKLRTKNRVDMERHGKTVRHILIEIET